MKYYNYLGEEILIAHFPGETRLVETETFYSLMNSKFHKPDNIGIVSVTTKDRKNPVLISQIKANGYDYYNALDKKQINWHPVKKIRYVLESLKEVKEEYCLILDGDDVLIINDLDCLIERFDQYNKKIIYNASVWMYPHIVIDRVPNRDKYGDYQFLNAGCCFGKTSDLIYFYQELWDYVKLIAHPVSSEQYYVRQLFNKKQDTVFFDWKCSLFQIWHKQELTYFTNEEGEQCAKLL